LILPRRFYEDFPFPGRTWVSMLGPYNEHLVQAALVAWLVYAVAHFVFHLAQIPHFSLGDNLAQLGLLGFAVLLPLALITLAARAGERGARTERR
jgi:hypothetical protein